MVFSGKTKQNLNNGGTFLHQLFLLKNKYGAISIITMRKDF